MASADRSTTIIRAARPDDLDDLVRVNFVAFRAGNGPALGPEALAELTVDAVRARWRRFLDHRPEGVTVTAAELAGRLCGFAGAGPLRDDDSDPSVGELYSLYVDPEQWGQGHGTALHEAAMLKLVRGGFASAALWVLEGNTRATRFYHVHGWAPDGARRPFMGATLLRLARGVTGERSRGWDPGRRPDVPPSLRVVPPAPEDLDAIVALLAAEGWSHGDDPDRTWRALTAPGSTVLVALAGEALVGAAQVLSDGEIQAFLALLVVSRAHRNEGIGRLLIDQAFARAGGRRLDVISCADSFYEKLGYRRVSAFRTTGSVG